MSYLVIAEGVLAILSAVLAWYNGSKAKKSEAGKTAADAAVDALRQVNTELRAALERAVAEVAARNEREAQNDARTAADAGTDAQRAADLLNGLHEDRAGPRPGGAGGVSPRPVPIVPGPERGPVR